MKKWKYVLAQETETQGNPSTGEAPDSISLVNSNAGESTNTLQQENKRRVMEKLKWTELAQRSDFEQIVDLCSQSPENYTAAKVESCVVNSITKKKNIGVETEKQISKAMEPMGTLKDFERRTFDKVDYDYLSYDQLKGMAPVKKK